MFLEVEPRKTLWFSGKKINCFPRDQNIVKYERKANLSTKTCFDISQLEKKTREIAQNGKSCSERKKLLEIREVAKKLSNNLWKTLTSSIVCEWTKKKHLGWIAKYVERFTTRINKFASKRLVWKQLQLIKMTGNLCHGVLAHFVVIANFASLCAMELKVNEETTCKRKKHSFFSNKCTFHALYQTLQTTQKNF